MKLGYLRAHVVPTVIYPVSADVGARAGDNARLHARNERAPDEFTALVTAVPQRQRQDEFDEPAPFDQLLAG